MNQRDTLNAEFLKDSILRSTINSEGEIVTRRRGAIVKKVVGDKPATFKFYTPTDELADLFEVMDRHEFADRNKDGGIYILNLGWLYNDGSIGKF